MAIVFWTGFKAVVDESQVLQSLLTFPDKQGCNLDMKVLRLTSAMSPSGFPSLFRVSAWISFFTSFFFFFFDLLCFFFFFFSICSTKEEECFLSSAPVFSLSSVTPHQCCLIFRSKRCNSCHLSLKHSGELRPYGAPEGLYPPLRFNIYSQYCLSQQRRPNSVSKLQFSLASGLSGRSRKKNESDVCGGRGRYEILYLTNVRIPPT